MYKREREREREREKREGGEMSEQIQNGLSHFRRGRKERDRKTEREKE